VGGNPGLSRWHGRRDVELGQKKDFTAEAKCGILCMSLPVKTGRTVTDVWKDRM